VPPLLAGVVIAYVLVLLPVPVIDVAFLPSQLALQSVQAPQSPMQLIGQFVLVHVESVSILLADGIHLPLYLASFVTTYVLDLVPVLDIDAVPSHIPSHSVQVFHSPMQLTGQFVIAHVESVSVLLANGIQLPPYSASFNTVYVLFFVPDIDVALLPSQIASQALQSLHFPTQAAGQSVFMHVESVSIVLVDGLQFVPSLAASVVIVYVLIFVPVPGIDVVLLLSQVALHLVHSPQLPTQLTGQFVIVQLESVSVAPFV
jgi:hypothetical protein